MHGQAAAALGDDAGALEHGEEAAGGLARGAGELGEVGLGGGEQHLGGVGAGADLLLDEVAQDDRDARLDGLEGLAGEALVGLAQAPAEGDHQARGDAGVLVHQPAHVGAEHGHDGGRLDSLDGGRAALVLEHGELAEDVAGTEGGERDDAPVGVLAHGAGAAGAHDVAGVAGVALAKDDLAGLELAGHGELGDALQVGGVQRGEHGHACEQFDDLG